MTNSARHRTGLIVLLTYLLSGLLIEVTHHDASDFRLQSVETIGTHNCGDKEIHVPIDKRHECVACSHLTWRVATPSVIVSVNQHALAFQCFAPNHFDHTLQTDGFSLASRGPPVS